MTLSDDELQLARKILGRDPNRLELGIFEAMWSEHCSYKSSRLHLRRLPTTGPRVLVGPGENAGVIDVGDGWAVAFKVESHNHPSYIEPYQGAATGVGGILRDVFTMGARPIAAMNLLRFGRTDHEKTPHLFDGVVRGIGGYGNCFGVPTVYSSTDFDEAYDGNILVNAFALGVLRADRIFKGTASGAGNPVMYVGAKTGRDGIHGATMASDAFREHEQQPRPTVQVGDPFKEKLLLEACLECFATDCLVGIQDMGAAGLTSSSFEMASRAGSGIVIDLDRVPQREKNMTPYELMLSESQERMLLVAQRGREEEVRKIFAKWDLDCVAIGEVTTDGFVRLRWHGEEVGVLPARALADEAPRSQRPTTPRPAPSVADESAVRNHSIADVARAIALSPTLASKTWVYTQYDREVGAGTILDGTRAPAALVRIPETWKAVAMALCCSGRWCNAGPREGARRAVVEGILRTTAVGAAPIGVTDCLNYGSPEVPEVMWTFVEGVEGIREACLAFDTPVVSGNVSLYNQTDARAVHPTPTCGVVGLVDDLRTIPRDPVLDDGAVLLRLGDASRSLQGSLALGGRGPLSAWDLRRARTLCDVVRPLRLDGSIALAWPVAEGGLWGALVEIARTTKKGLFGSLPEGEDAYGALFGEDAVAFVVVVLPSKLQAVSARAALEGVPCEVLGGIGGHALVVAVGEQPVVEWDVARLIEESEAVIPRIAAGRG